MITLIEIVSSFVGGLLGVGFMRWIKPAIKRAALSSGPRPVFSDDAQHHPQPHV